MYGIHRHMCGPFDNATRGGQEPTLSLFTAAARENMWAQYGGLGGAPPATPSLSIK